MKIVLSAIICILAILSYNFHHLKSIATSLLPASILQLAEMSSSHTATDPYNTSFAGLPPVPPSDPSLEKDESTSIPRAIKQVLLAQETAEGVGATVRRSIGTPKLRNLSPFLMLDHFSVSPGAGFPDHPHRGQVRLFRGIHSSDSNSSHEQETITYLLRGAVDHEDFAGNKGTIESGDLQFMTAGRGIMHAEMPRQNPDGSANVGLQLWVDLPASLKKCEPRYRDLRAKEIPEVEADDGKVKIKVISGQSHGVDSVKELAYTPVWLLDVTMKPGGRLVQNLPVNWNAFVYTLEGNTRFGAGSEGQVIGKYHNVVLEQTGDSLVAEVDQKEKEDSKFVVIAGMPLDQKVVQYGPFVLNSQDEVRQAIMDFQMSKNGFERGLGWKSQIGKSMAY